jgi:hypothetical protein
MKSALSVYLRSQQILLSGTLFFGVVVQGSSDVSSVGIPGFQTPSQADAVTRAAGTLGSSEHLNIALIRELQVWRGRALEAEGKLSGQQQVASSPLSGQRFSSSALKFNVIATLAPERVVLVSCGKNSGVFEGALISIGSGVKAKVVESRSEVSAAVIENGFQGKVSMLEGQPAQLVLVR